MIYSPLRSVTFRPIYWTDHWCLSPRIKETAMQRSSRLPFWGRRTWPNFFPRRWSFRGRNKIPGSLMKRGPTSTVGERSGASRVLRSSDGCPKRRVVAHCRAAGGQLSVSVVFLELCRPIFEADQRSTTVLDRNVYIYTLEEVVCEDIRVCTTRACRSVRPELKN